MPRPNWTYVKLDVLLPENDRWGDCGLVPQLLGESTLSRSLMYCHTALTDGFISSFRWKQLGCVVGRRELLARGFVREVEGGVEIPHYLDYYPSKADLEKLSQQRREAGLRGAEAKRLRKQLASGEPSNLLDSDKQNPRGRLTRKGKGKGIYPPAPSSDLQVEGSGPRSAGSTSDDDESSFDPRDDELAGVVQREVRIRTGGGHISEDHAAALAAQLLGGRTVRNRAAYLRKVIQDERNPRARFLPAEHPGLAGDLCTFCAQHGHREAECPVKAEDADRPARKATTPGGFQAPSRRPPPDVAKRGAELARELMRQAGDEPDEIPF